ncbi:hypothetical protein QUA54_05885 [Microcoleus sp. MOSTC5]
MKDNIRQLIAHRLRLPSSQREKRSPSLSASQGKALLRRSSRTA